MVDARNPSERKSSNSRAQLIDFLANLVDGQHCYIEPKPYPRVTPAIGGRYMRDLCDITAVALRLESNLRNRRSNPVRRLQSIWLVQVQEPSPVRLHTLRCSGVHLKTWACDLRPRNDLKILHNVDGLMASRYARSIALSSAASKLFPADNSFSVRRRYLSIQYVQAAQGM